jgi:hypothetical protein
VEAAISMAEKGMKTVRSSSVAAFFIITFPDERLKSEQNSTQQ